MRTDPAALNLGLRSFSKAKPWIVLALGGLLVLAGLACFSAAPKPTSKVAQATYIDSRRCQACHATIYENYQHVGMARAFAPVDRASAIEDYDHNAGFVHAKSGRRYQVLKRGNRVFQRRFELDAKGRVTNAFELEATHAVGSGNHARTYLNRSQIGEFTELPITWYSQEKRWGLSPGFDQASPPDFTRIVDDRCLFCHNGYPDSNGKLAEGIDCQRCHGPGSRHVELASDGRTHKPEIAAAIANPAHMEPERQLEVCMQCHLETTSTPLPSMVRRFDREIYSLRPGERLGDYAIQFDEEPGAGRADKFEIVGQAYRLRQSACFLKSNGRLTCTTCHNPHTVKRDVAAACRSCHPAVSAANHPASGTAGCVACHMPSRRTEDAVHVVMTDHLIQRGPPSGDLKGPRSDDTHRPLGRPTIYYPAQMSEAERELYLGAALIVNGAGRARGIEMLERQLRPDTPVKAIAVLGEGYLAEGAASKAIDRFRRALASDPGLVKARYNLAQALEQAGNTAEARQEYEHTLRLQPAFPEAENALANLLMKMGDRAAAAEHQNAAIRLRPTYAEAYSNLGVLTADSGKLEQALGINPAFEDAHINLALVLAAEGRIPDAIAHTRRALAFNEKNAVAHYNLGRLLHETGATAAAIAEYRRALGIRPDFPEALEMVRRSGR
jgi:tetratricopeptide (TPR) repeat protein